jgi:hypothetical protein
MKHKFGTEEFAGRGVVIRAVVVDPQRCEVGHHRDKVKAAVLEAPVDMLGCDNVTVAANASLDSFDVQLRSG